MPRRRPLTVHRQLPDLMMMGDMTASTDSEVPKLDLAFKEGETIKINITVPATTLSVGQTLYLDNEVTD